VILAHRAFQSHAIGMAPHHADADQFVERHILSNAT
jgi:hypothetical protein